MVKHIEERKPTPSRRRMLQASVVGAVSAAGLTSTAGAAEACDVTQDDKAVVRERYGTEGQLVEAIRRQDGLQDALREYDVVEGEDDAVLIYAPVVECEPIPEFRIFRKVADGRHLTLQVRPNSDMSYAVARVPDDYYDDDYDFDDPCQGIWKWWMCGSWCYDDGCCSCEKRRQCGCEGAQVPCDPLYCCVICDCSCDWFDCPQHCDLPGPAPEPVPVERDWLHKAVDG